MAQLILVLNPGSTSTKAAVYDGTRPLFSRSIPHSNQDLAPFPTLNDQLDYRVALVRGLLAQERVDLSTLTAVVGRGGILPNIVAGGYQVNDALVDCLLHYPVFEHASNLGGVMALAFARPLGIPAYIYDAVTSDELLPEARITGFKGVTRTSFCHVLNARATAHKYAESRGLAYKDMNLVVAHLGGGISISAHSHGQIIDSVSDDAGPFSPDRSGSTNTLYVVDLCYSGKYTKAEMLKKLRGEGGMSALLGTHDCREIERRIQAGDERAALVYKAQALQIAKGVGTLLGCFTELIDAVILTGGLAYSKMLTDMSSATSTTWPGWWSSRGKMRWRPWPWAACACCGGRSRCTPSPPPAICLLSRRQPCFLSPARPAQMGRPPHPPAPDSSGGIGPDQTRQLPSPPGMALTFPPSSGILRVQIG